MVDVLRFPAPVRDPESGEDRLTSRSETAPDGANLLALMHVVRVLIDVIKDDYVSLRHFAAVVTAQTQDPVVLSALATFEHTLAAREALLQHLQKAAHRQGSTDASR